MSKRRRSRRPICSPNPLSSPAGKTRIGGSGFRIGIAWQGYSGRREDKGRSMPLALFRVLARVPGVRLISLQKGEGEEQIAGAGFPVEMLDGLR